MNNLVSYVVPAYNCGKFIRESIQRAFDQTYSPLEIVLSDDCSPDNTFDIMREMASDYQGPHKIVLNRNPMNLGITRHMNKLFLELAQGEIIVVAHGDDVSEPNRAEILVKYLDAHPKCMQVASSAIVCDGNLRPLSAYLQKKIQVHEVRTYDFEQGGHVAVGFSAFRKNVMEFFGPLNEECPTEDDPVGFRCILMGKLALLPDLLVRYRKHEGSMSNPEKFIQFPLEKIYEQEMKDMSLAVSHGLVTSKQATETAERMYQGMLHRKVYRNYFARRTWRSLWPLLTYPGSTLRRRLSYLREHLEYLMGHHE